MSFIVPATSGEARPDLAQCYQEYDASGIQLAYKIAMPFANVDEQRATIPSEKPDDMLRIEDMDRGPGGHYNRVNTRLGSVAYSCEGKGLEFPIHLGDGRLFQLPSLAKEEAAARQLRVKADLWFEQQVSTAIFGLGSAQALNVAWDLPATSQPLTDIANASRTVQTATGVTPNTLILNLRNWNYLVQSASVKAWFPGAVMITKELIGQALAGMYGITRIAVSSAQKNTAEEGLPMVAASIFPDNLVAVAYCAESDMTPYTAMSCGRIFNWVEDSATPLILEQYMWEPTRSLILRVRNNVDVNLWNPNLVKLITVD